MKQVSQQKKVLDCSIILKNFGKIDYQDSYLVKIDKRDSVDSIATKIFASSPKWANWLLKSRDFMVKCFGLKTTPKDLQIEPYYNIGSRLALFTVSDRNEHEIVMAENDKHLNFRTSVLVVEAAGVTSVYLTTIVQYNNFFGRFYFTVIKPFHRMIVKSYLRRFAEL